MSSIDGSGHCLGKHNSTVQQRPLNNQGAQQAKAPAAVQTQPGQSGTASQGNSRDSLANTMVASERLSSAWQGSRDGTTRVAVIDDFATSHGSEIDGIIRSGGAPPAGNSQSGNPNIETVRFNINNGGNRTRNIANSLDQVARLAAQGQHFDAVNISQQDFANNNDTAAVRQKIDFLQREFGIPVVVAAGNNGNGVRNALAGSAAFVVENSTRGSNFRAAGSVGGNVRSEGRFTSQAAANVTARVAQLREMGFSFSQIQGLLQREALAEGGSLDSNFF